MPQTRRGFVFMTSLLVLAGMASFVAIGLTRSMTELVATNRFLASHQAFHLAEAGLDEAIATLTADPNASLPCAGIAGLTWGTSSCTITPQPDGTRLIDAWGFVPNAAAPIAQEHLQVTLQPATTQDLFPYTVMADRLIVGSNTTLGEPSKRIQLYIDDEKAWSQPVSLDVSSGQGVTVWASLVDFRNPWNQPLRDSDWRDEGLCPSCVNPDGTVNTAIFPTPPGESPTTFTTSGVSAVSLPLVDFTPYYTEARNQWDQNDPCKKYHYIGNLAGSTVTLNGADCPTGLTGIIYVEKGVNVKITNNFKLYGTIVHEGISCTMQCSDGRIELGNSTNLEIYSRQGSGKGMAIIGAPRLNFRNNPGSTIFIDGFMMAGGTFDNWSSIKTDGTITGGVIGAGEWGGFLYPNVQGPEGERGAPIIEFMHLTVEVGAVTLLFQPLTETPTGFSPTGSGSSGNAPAVLLWSAE